MLKVAVMVEKVEDRLDVQLGVTPVTSLSVPTVFIHVSNHNPIWSHYHQHALTGSWCQS
jgi:hypothetical protein